MENIYLQGKLRKIHAGCGLIILTQSTKVLFKMLLDSNQFYLYVFGYSGIVYTYIMSVAGLLKAVCEDLYVLTMSRWIALTKAGMRMGKCFTLSGKWMSLL